jgi:mannosylfructose-phosphate synthase
MPAKQVAMKADIRHVAMLSTHGYFDPVPQLGRTDTGGQVVYVLELAKALAGMGLEVDIFTRWFEPGKQQVGPVPGHPAVRVIRIRAGDWGFIPKETIYGVLPQLAGNMTAFIRDHRLEYDLYHGHYVDAGIVTLGVAGRMGKPAFFTAHSLGAWKRDQMGGDPADMERRFNFSHRIAEERKIFAGVNGQTVTSEVQKEKMKELYGWEAGNIAVIPPGVDVHRYRPDSPGRHLAADGLPGRYIYNLSRIDSNKGLDFLLYAFELASAEVPDVHLVIGGGSPDPKPGELEVFRMIREIIAERKLGDRVHIIGYVADDRMVGNYLKAELFVLPSLFEPFGMTTQEAMACGKPVVASRFGGIRNIIRDGVNGLLVDPSDPKEFARAMVRLLRDDDLRKNMGREAHATTLREFSWEAIAGRFLDFYQKYM